MYQPPLIIEKQAYFYNAILPKQKTNNNHYKNPTTFQPKRHQEVLLKSIKHSLIISLKLQLQMVDTEDQKYHHSYIEQGKDWARW